MTTALSRCYSTVNGVKRISFEPATNQEFAEVEALGQKAVAPLATYLDLQPKNDLTQLFAVKFLMAIGGSFSAKMYAMWDPNLPNSIPVPLGYVQWNFTGDATIANASTNQWVLKSSSAGSNNTFTQSSSYPQWSGTLGSGDVCH
jgi:hypothetical protein